MNTLPQFSAPNTGALRFADVDGESVTVAHDAALSAANWTAEAWVTTTNTDGDFNRVVTKAVGGNQTYSIVVINGEAQIRSSVGVITSTGVTVADGEPHHIAGVYNSVSDTLALYVDGALISSISTTGQTLIQGTEDVFIGDYPAPFVEAFDGDISDVRIWSEARTTAEISATFDQPLTNGAPNLELHLRFDGDATDSSGNGRDGVINGSPVFVEGLAPVDPAPFAPMALTATEDVSEAITGLQVSDADPGAILTVTVEAASGALTLASTTGLTFSAGGNGSATFTAQGTVADLNAALATLSYLGDPDFNGADNIVLTVDDGQPNVVEPVSGALVIPNAGFFFIYDFDTGTGFTEAQAGATPAGAPTNGVYININPNNAEWGATASLVEDGVTTFLPPANFVLAGYAGGSSITGDAIVFEDAITGLTLTYTNEDTPTPTGARDITFTFNGLDFTDTAPGNMNLDDSDFRMSSEAVVEIPVTVASVVDAAPVITQVQTTGSVFEPEANAKVGFEIDDFDQLDGANGFNINGQAAEERLGNEVAGLGDVNGDGFDDFIVGVYGADPGGLTNVGAAHIVFGDAGGLPANFDVSTLDGLNGFTFNGVEGSDSVGASVDGIGDINSDGFDDIIIGARGASEVFSYGEAYIVYGKASGFASSLTAADLDGVTGTAVGGVSFSSFGGSVSGAGDVNGDGIDDLIVGAQVRATAAGSQAGATYIVFGQTGGLGASVDVTTLSGPNGFKIEGVNAGDRLGISVDGGGDFNGDGFDDLLIGAYRASSNGLSLNGAAYVVFGAPGGFDGEFDLNSIDGTNGFIMEGNADTLRLGREIGVIGDVNNDGLDDFAIGSTETSPNGVLVAGQVYVVFGQSAGGFPSNLDLYSLDGTDGFTINGIAQGDRIGGDVTAAGDLNADGVDDFIIGAQDQAFVIFGDAAGFGATLELSSLDGQNGVRIDDGINGSAVGRAVAGIGDFNGDGIDDINAADRVATINGNSAAGRSATVFGASENAAASGDIQFQNGASRDSHTVTSALTSGLGLGVFTAEIVDAHDPNGLGVVEWNFLASASDLDPLAAGETIIQTYDVTIANPDNSVVQTITVTINGANDTPIALDDTFSVSEDLILVGNLLDDNGAGLDTDPDAADMLTLTEINGVVVTDGEVVTLGSGAQLTVFANGDIQFDPTAAFDNLSAGETGVEGFAYTIGDGEGGFATASANITINGENDTPIALGDTFSVSEDLILVGNLLDDNGAGLDTDPDAADVLTLTEINGVAVADGEVVTLASGAQLTVFENGDIQFDPTAAFDNLSASETGVEGFAYTIDDGEGGSATATANITINGANDTPIAQDDGFTVSEDLILVGDLLADSGLGADSDADASDTLVVTEIDGVAVTDGEVVMLASGAELTINADGSFTFDGRDAFNGVGASGGSDTFTYTIADIVGATSTATASITIDAVNDPPVISAPQQGGAARFDGNAANAVTVAHDPALSTASWTVEAWITTTDADADFNRILTKPVAGNQTYSLVVRNGEAHVRFGVPGDNSVQSGFVADGQPHHIAGVFDAATDTLSLLVDGVLTGQLITPNTPPQGTEPLNIGRVSQSFTSSFEGDISEVRVWSFARSDVEIGNDFDQKLTAGEPGLELYLTFDGDVTDQSGNGRDGAITGVVPLIAGAAPVDATFTVVEDLPASLAGIFIDDPDAGAGIIRLTLSVDNGLLNFTNLAGAAQTSSPATSATITLEGELAQLNTALQTLTYVSDLNFNGAETLTITVDDLGNSGSGGPLTDTQTVVFDVTAVNDAPVAVDDALATDEETPISGDLFADNGAGADLDSDFDSFSITEINGASVTDGQMLTLASGAGLVIRSDGTFDYDPTAAFEVLADGGVGVDSFTYTITDDQGATSTATANFDITGLNDEPVAEDDILTTDEDTVLSGDLFANNSFGPDSDVDNGALLSITEINGTPVFDGEPVVLPSGAILLIRTDGTFDYDPNGAFDGLAEGVAAPDSFTYTLADEFGAISIATANITVFGVNDAPQAFDETYNLDEDTPISDGLLFDANSDGLVSFDPNGDPLTISQINGAAIFNGVFITLASGAALTIRTDGTFDYDPLGQFQTLGAGATGTDSFTFQVDDGLGAVATATALLDIAGLNDAPTAQDDNFAVNEDAPIVGNLLADNGFGEDADIDAGDILTVSRINGALVSNGQTVSLASGTALTIGGDGSFTYDQRGVFDQLPEGSATIDTFTYEIDDGRGGVSIATASLTIEGVNDLPTAADDEIFVTEDAPVSGDLLADNGFGFDDDPESGNLLTVTEINGATVTDGQIITLASGANLTIRVDGAFDYDPAGAFENLAVGAQSADDFTYTVADELGASATATATVTIIGANDAPVALFDEFTTASDTPVSGDLRADNGFGADFDIDGASILSVTAINGQVVLDGQVVTLASGANLTIRADGTFDYDPAGAFDALGDGEFVNETFTYTLSDGQGGASDTTASLFIAGVNDPPVAAIDAFEGVEDAGFSGDLTADNGFGADADPDTGDVLLVTEINGAAVTDDAPITLPSGAVLTLRTDGTFDYDPAGAFETLAAGAFGADNFAYTLSDEIGATSQATVEIAIAGANDAPLARDDAFSTDENTAIGGLFLLADNGAGADTDRDGDTLSLASIDGVDISAGDTVLLTSGAAVLVGVGGEVIYDPNGAFEALESGEAATDSFVYQTTDGQGGASEASVRVEIAGVSDILFGTADSDVLEGTAGADEIRALDGDDFVSGFAGDDIIDGGAGNDRARGGEGEDSITGGDGDDALFGESGDDVLAGGDGADRLRGQRGDDRLLGQNGDDVLAGARGDDTLIGGVGDDTLAGGGENDHLRGRAGDDKLGGSRGDDILQGGTGADRIRGGDGDDTLVGGKDDDTLIGGAGDDVFQFARNDGSDIIRRFQQDADLIQITSDEVGFENLSIVQQGADVLISFGAGDLLVSAQSTADFSVEDFIFFG